MDEFISLNDESKIQIIEKIEKGCKGSIEIFLKWLGLKYDKSTINRISRHNRIVYSYYSYFIEELINHLCESNLTLNYIIFYEAPPENINNYLLRQNCISQYQSVLAHYPKFSSPEIVIYNPPFRKFNLRFAKKLIENRCLFIDIFPIPYEFNSKCRKRLSTSKPSITFELFRLNNIRIIKHFKLSKNTKFALGMPPNSSLGIYNCLPQNRYQYQALFHKNGYYHYQKLIRGNDFLNRSTLKGIEYADSKFNSHRSNVSTGQNPDLTLLKYAWCDESKLSSLKTDINYFFSEIYRGIKGLFSVLDRR